MKRFLPLVLLVWCVLALSPFAQAADDPKRLWHDAKASLKQGAYRHALESLEILLTITPNDPWAQLYRSLCELRLKSPPAFPQLSAAQLTTLHQRLHEEERLQRRFAAQQQAIERQLSKEQARWDHELEAFERQVQLDSKRQRQHAQAEAVQRTRQARAQAREAAQQEAVSRLAAEPTGPAAVPPREPTVAPPTEPHAVVGAGQQPVELAPVVVPTAPGEPAGEPPISPSLVGRPAAPPGAVHINARQMSVSPDRKIAVAEGDVEIVFDNVLLTCDRATLFTDTKDVYAEGRVRLEEGAQVFRGELAQYNLATKKGRFLQGTLSSPPWYEHGRSVEHIAEGVYQVTPGYLTSCELEPPHFKFYGRRAIVFADEKLARMRNVALVVERVPFLYLPWLSIADRQSPFFLIPGKKKPWGQFALMGYRYELPDVLGDPGSQNGTIKLDWRRHFGWGVGADHQFESERWGEGLLKLYYNEEENRTRLTSDLPKGALRDRYRLLWRHDWRPTPDTTVITDIQEFSDVDFRRELLFREEFTEDDNPETFLSVVKNTPDFTLTGLARKRMNRFETVDETLPQLTFDVREQPIGVTGAYSQTTMDLANFQTKRAHSDDDTAVARADWFQQLSYALNLFRPILMTPRMGIRQTYYTREAQNQSTTGAKDERDILSGQFSAGADTSLKLFRVFPVQTNFLRLNVNVLRHVVTPTVKYTYVHQPTVPSRLLHFAAASGTTNELSFGLENKLQTKRVAADGKVRGVDLARAVASVPYAFHGNGNKQGGRLGDWAFDLEVYPWPWMRLESDWTIPSHFVKGTRDDRIQRWNLDLVVVGGRGTPHAQQAHEIQVASSREVFEPGPRGGAALLLPEGQWYLGLGHRYSQNDKTEDVLEFDWRLSDKWEIRTFHRFDWKEVAGTTKRFSNLREYQYVLRRDLHDWLAELVYRVDREFGEELFLTVTLKAYPQIPIEFEDSYHQPKIGSQSSPFSPIRGPSSL